MCSYLFVFMHIYSNLFIFVHILHRLCRGMDCSLSDLTTNTLNFWQCWWDFTAAVADSFWMLCFDVFKSAWFRMAAGWFTSVLLVISLRVCWVNQRRGYTLSSISFWRSECSTARGYVRDYPRQLSGKSVGVSMIGAGRPDMICDDSSANFSVYNVYSWQELACNSERPITTDQIIANLVLLRLGLAEGCAKPSLPIGYDSIPIPLFHMSQLKV